MDRFIGHLYGNWVRLINVSRDGAWQGEDGPKLRAPYNCYGNSLCSRGYQSQIDGFWRFAALFPSLELLLANPESLWLRLSTRKIVMPIGTVKFFNNAKGFGFIKPDSGETDAFVHISAVERAGMATLDTDQRVSYELEEDRRGRTSAVNLQQA